MSLWHPILRAVGDMLKSVYDPDEDGVVDPAVFYGEDYIVGTGSLEGETRVLPDTKCSNTTASGDIAERHTLDTFLYKRFKCKYQTSLAGQSNSIGKIGFTDEINGAPEYNCAILIAPYGTTYVSWRVRRAGSASGIETSAYDFTTEDDLEIRWVSDTLCEFYKGGELKWSATTNVPNSALQHYIYTLNTATVSVAWWIKGRDMEVSKP